MVSPAEATTWMRTFPRSHPHLQRLLDRPWLLPVPDSKIQRLELSLPGTGTGAGGTLDSCSFSLREGTDVGGAGFYVIRDDLLHPLMGGNKLRKLDAVIPVLKAAAVSDVVTCGGCQSAHTAALAVAAAQNQIRAHLLLRGEAPAVATGYNLVSGMCGQVTYVNRKDYADREGMLAKHAARIAGDDGLVMWLDGHVPSFSGRQVLQKRVAVVKEGAGQALALLGLIRLVEYLCQPSAFGCSEPLQMVVDSGTGTTAVGLALGVALFRLPWTIVGVMLADTEETYDRHKLSLLSDFRKQISESDISSVTEALDHLQLPLKWIQRQQPRRFGKVLPGEIETCQQIARQTGVLLDPIYTLSAWETAVSLCMEASELANETTRVVALHTGGTLGLFGLAQRYPSCFS